MSPASADPDGLQAPAAGDSTRERLLEAARAEFSVHGFEGARVDRIARRAGVNKAMIYYHFRSKSELYEAVIEGFLGQLSGFLEHVFEEEDDLEGFLTAVAGYYVRFFEASQQFAPIVLREIAAGGDRIRGLFMRTLTDAGVVDRIRELFDAEARAGRLRDVEVPHAFVSFVGMNLFYLLFAPILNPIWEIQDETDFRRSRPEAVVDLFLNGIRTR